MNLELIQNPESVAILTVEYILANKEVITDFFGDNRKWYQILVKGGMKFGKTSLDSQEEYDVDLPDPEFEADRDLPPLDEKKLTEARAVNVSKFFEEYPEAQAAFKAYAGIGSASV